MSIDTAADANFGDSGAGENTLPLKRLLMLLFSFLFVAGISSLATASQPIFAIEKNFCAGVPSTSASASPQSCALATQVAQGDPVYYVISITSPWGQPQQVVDLIDQYPVGFVPTTGGLFCKDNLGNPVPSSPSSLLNGIAQVTLNMAQTIHCFVPGTFQDSPTTPAPNDDTGNKKNTVQGKNKDGYDPTANVQTEVLQTNPLGTDLSVSKTSSGPIDITSAPGTITYTITITNNGPADVDIGEWFTLHDNLSLAPGSVPFNVEYVGSSCVVNASGGSSNSNAATDCLDPNGPNLVNGSPVFVGLMNPKPFLNWRFQSGEGHINAGDSITLTITVEVSQLVDIDCYAALNADGLRNTAFFTLINPKDGSAFADAKPANNTATVTTGITTGQKIEDPDCGTAHLRITKDQISPTPITADVAWGPGSPVTYEITITNVSLPNQAITIKKGDMQDAITQGINTPRFNRHHLGTKCVSSSIPSICAPFAPGINVSANPFQYLYYGHLDTAWKNGVDLTLPAKGDWVKFHTTFDYIKPDCETVPNGYPKPIFNTIFVEYMASAFGANKPKPQNVKFNQDATAQTNMKKQPPCKFLVTKVMDPNSPTKVQFGVPMNYIVRYTNLGNRRTIGTIMDLGRIDIPDYATSMPMSSKWKCKTSTGPLQILGHGPLIGSNGSGSLTHTATPAMGSQVILNLGNNIDFPMNGWIECNVSVTIERPPFNDPYCTTKPAYFQNMAMMDTTHPFNTNIHWPANGAPSGTFTPGSMTNPVPQDRNWAMAMNLLPRCWDAHVEKSASVGGLPPLTPAWTYAGNTNPVDFKITTTNDADSDLGSSPSPGNGWIVTDTVGHTPNGTGDPVPSPLYTNANNQQGSPVCSPLGWCWSTGASNDGKKQIGIKKLTPGANGGWNIKNLGPWTTGINIRNCAEIKPEGDRTGGDWYDNRANDPARLKSCADVPVVETTKISVRKQVIDLTGAGVKAMGSSGNQFNFSVSCSPYAIPTVATSTFGLSTNSTGFSGFQPVTPVARFGSCIITETSKPAIPAAMATKCNGAGNVLQTSNSPVTLTSLAAIDNPVTITNTYKCKPLANTGDLEVIKEITNPVTAAYIPPQTYPMTVSCIPASGGPAVVTPLPMSGWPGTFGMVNNIPVGSTCTVTEQVPTVSIPATLANNCPVGTTFAWNDPAVYVPSSGSVVIVAGVNVVRVKNTWSCKPNIANGQINLTKVVQGPTAQLPDMTFTINAACSPVASVSSAAITTSYPHSGTTGGPIVAPVGASCTLSEVQPLPVNASMTAFCPANTTPTWQTWPPVSITITAAPQNLTVTNVWSCVPNYTGPTDELEIIKTVQGPAISTQFPQTTFNIGVNCAGTAYNKPITTSATSNGTFTNSGSLIVPENSNCVISETPPPIPLAAITYCKTYAAGSFGAVNTSAMWEEPVYTPSPNIAMGPGIQTVTVTNKWKCVSGHPLGIQVIKTVQGPAGAPVLPLMPFAISKSCNTSGTVTNGSVTINTATTSTAVNVGTLVNGGSYCNITEVQPPLPPEAQTYCTTQTPGSIATWNAPTYSLPMPILADSNVIIKLVTVTNSWFCLSNQKVAPKKKKKSKFKINIGIGIGGGGGGRDNPKPKPPRDIPNGP